MFAWDGHFDASEDPGEWQFFDWERYWPTIVEKPAGQSMTADRLHAHS